MTDGVVVIASPEKNSWVRISSVVIPFVYDVQDVKRQNRENVLKMCLYIYIYIHLPLEILKNIDTFDCASPNSLRFPRSLASS